MHRVRFASAIANVRRTSFCIVLCMALAGCKSRLPGQSAAELSSLKGALAAARAARDAAETELDSLQSQLPKLRAERQAAEAAKQQLQEQFLREASSLVQSRADTSMAGAIALDGGCSERIERLDCGT